MVAFGVAADELAHFLAEGHVRRRASSGSRSPTFAVSWAWINFSWFASAYDTDDWVYRLTTMVQMVGVFVLALGLPAMFESLRQGDDVDNRVMVRGLRRHARGHGLPVAAGRPAGPRPAPGLPHLRDRDPGRPGRLDRAGARATSMLVTSSWAVVLVLVELAGPVIAERRRRHPWHPHHIAERYGLLVIIALGEVPARDHRRARPRSSRRPGWTVDVALLGLAGIGLAFGLWWFYFVIPVGDLLARHRERSFGWGYGHIAALRRAGRRRRRPARRRRTTSRSTAPRRHRHGAAVAVPVGLYLGAVLLLYAELTRPYDPFHLLLLALTAAVLAASVLLAPPAPRSPGACSSWRSPRG